MLLAAMRMTFPNEDTKLMVFEKRRRERPDRSENVSGDKK
jgi:hypothetical protein